MLPDGNDYPRRIIVIRLDNIGDVIMLGPALRAINQAFPQANITLMASPAGAQVAPLLPWVDDVFVWRASWQEISDAERHDPELENELIERLRRGKYDLALIFTSFSQSPYPPAYACYLAGIPTRAGQSKEFGGIILTHWAKSPDDNLHQVERNLSLLVSLGLSVENQELELVIPASVRDEVDLLLSHKGVEPGQPLIALAPGASCSSRRYPGERFARVVDLLCDMLPARIMILGSERETAQLQPITRKAGRKQVVDFVGQTTIPQAADIIRRSALVIANNSASLHIADAFRIPMVILYSGTDLINQWKPRSSRAVLLQRQTDCSPCYRFSCPYHLECLEIQPQEVADAVIRLATQEKVFATEEGDGSPPSWE